MRSLPMKPRAATGKSELAFPAEVRGVCVEGCVCTCVVCTCVVCIIYIYIYIDMHICVYVFLAVDPPLRCGLGLGWYKVCLGFGVGLV